ncbi:MAG: hypothetical protein PHG87_00285 [Candidatus Omnitrophica bacterium]|nr:hypothetical protein [Candidatus Omnitrophota bacterium]
MFNRKARSFVTIMIVAALSALLLRLAVQKIIIYNIEHNQLLAQVNLKLLSTGLENYAKNNKNVYPTSIEQLTKSNPVYLERNYLASSSIRGYEYDCQRLDASGYNCSAVPVDCKLTGKMTYSVSTGGLVLTESCDKK